VLVNQLKRLTIAVTAIALAGVLAWGQQQQQQKSPWKDRAEYDLYNSIVKEKDPSKKLQLLDTYMKKYPDTNFKLNIYLMYTQTYQALKQPEKMYESAQKILELDPENIQGLYFLTSLTASMAKTDPDFLARGERAAKKLIDKISKMEKPAKLSEEAWKKQRDSLLILGHQTLGWIAMTRKDNLEAERQFRQVLKLQPRNGQVSYWLGTVILAQRNPDKQSEAFFHFARAVALKGEGAMPEQARQEVEKYLRKIYVTFHGDESGLDDMLQLASQQPFPPEGFIVKSKEQIAIEKEEKLRRENPMLYMWLKMKEQLEAPNGVEYFKNEVYNAALPELRGYLIAQSPAQRPDTLVLGISDRSTREVTLKLVDEAFRYPAPRGTVIRFQCVPRRFTQQPFNLGFDCEKAKVRGWPPPPRRRRAAPSK